MYVMNNEIGNPSRHENIYNGRILQIKAES